MDVGSQFFSPTAGFGEGSGRRAEELRKAGSQIITSMNPIELKPLAFTSCRPCALRRLCAGYACGYRSRGYWPPSTADRSGAWAIVPSLLGPHPVPRIRQRIVEPL